ncbi:MAG: phosphoglycerate mutase (2,3-diphosphoglycerate-independent) [Candidatus Amoebophilus sp. 36-38]|nr:MAG: phosphoglycerate mutase (2,3-diphosphoglycerate-independent) [Candidatus Amoebophilus sp. 36-38]
MDKKVLLMILDGWGLIDNPCYSAIAHAKTPFIDSLYQRYPFTQLEASGSAVGLPKGQMGNSEVGHMHLGAGRVIPQDLVRIDEAIQSGELANNPTWIKAISYAKQQQKPVHLIGLVSDGGVHSHIDHLKGLCDILRGNNIKTYIHAFTDGRDADPHNAIHFITQLIPYIQDANIELATILGRYYAMDRDKRWERTKIAYDALVHGIGTRTQDWEAAIKKSYAAGITDEFLQPIVLTRASGELVATIQPGDVVLCFNFRTDRGRQITEVLTQTPFPSYQMHPLPLYYLTLTVYDDTFRGVSSIFKKLVLTNTLGEVLSTYGKKQLRIAETEKYPHVTYFFSGGREVPFVGEERILCPSPQVATYDLAPAMSAYEITQRLIPPLEQKRFDFICLNFANPDMVGHTGVWEAAIEACEVVDRCVEKVVTHALQNNYITLLVSDHGNVEQMLQEEGTPYTAHTTNPVPCILIDPVSKQRLHTGGLIDVAPTILKSMNLPIPSEMNGRPLY